MVVTVDTNVFINALFFKDPWCLKVLENEAKELIVFSMNQATYTELQVVFALHVAESIDRANSYRLYSKLTNIMWRVMKTPHTIKTKYCVDDPNDNKFIDCAIESKAQYLITENTQHISSEFEPLIKKQYGQDLKIMGPYQFINELNILRLKTTVNSRRLGR